MKDNMRHITTLEARNQFSELLNETAYGKERVILTRRGRELAVLVPLEDLKLIEEAEDLYDLKLAMEAMEESDPEKRIPLHSLAEELKISLS